MSLLACLSLFPSEVFKSSLEQSVACTEDSQCNFRPSTSPLTHSSPSQTSSPSADGYCITSIHLFYCLNFGYYSHIFLRSWACTFLSTNLSWGIKPVAYWLQDNLFNNQSTPATPKKNSRVVLCSVFFPPQHNVISSLLPARLSALAPVHLLQPQHQQTHIHLTE